ncbi:hypothetical protein P692DRAFT_201861006 [Suillus brevipes Sb2]|nr:hypothetical protein P692DRAFT_201861006 [Suillus brevipes Sb2]
MVDNVEQCRAALKRCPPDHSDRSKFLSNLGYSLRERFTQRGVPSDLDECIELHRAALLLRPPGHSKRWYSLNYLALSLRNRFTQRGVPSDPTSLALISPSLRNASAFDSTNLRRRFRRGHTTRSYDVPERGGQGVVNSRAVLLMACSFAGVVRFYTGTSAIFKVTLHYTLVTSWYQVEEPSPPGTESSSF